MELFFCQYTNQGGRRVNEDSIGLTENVAVVADGLGGQGDGDLASQACVKRLLSMPSSGVIDNEEMHRVIDSLNDAVCEAKRAVGRPSQMATTVVAAFVQDSTFNYLNVGDSRLYFFRNHKIHFMSKDHSVTQTSVDLGEITFSQMRFHEDRNKLTKALGLNDTIKISNQFHEVELLLGDAYLLCTDGFWEYVYEKEMEHALKKSKTPQQWMERMIKIIEKRAPQSCDNRSAICAMVV